MHKTRILSTVAGALAATALLASTAFADTPPPNMAPIAPDGPPHPGNTFNVGDSMNVAVGPQEAAGELFRMSYPGGSAPVLINARIDGLDSTLMDAAGFDVYDDENGTNVVEHVTLARNEFNSDPHLMQFAYSSAKAQTVTVQFFNWSKAPLTLAVMPMQLPVAIVQTGETVPGSANPVGVSSVAGVKI
jgi:hypothetical protein